MAKNQSEYTFTPKFTDFVAYYTGLIDVWIGDGTLPVGQEYEDEHGIKHYKGGTAGYLYGMYQSGDIDEIGYVSDYEAAKKYYEDHGLQIDLTYEEWVNILMELPKDAGQAMLWAYGRDEGDWSLGKSSREQANRSMIWAVGSGEDTSNGSVTNNSKYWAEQSKSFTNGKDLSDNPVQERTTDNAEYFKNQAKLWANNGVQGDSPDAENNARHWAEQAKSYSDGKNLADTADIRATDNAEYYKEEARQWVGSNNEHASATDNAIYFKDQAKLWANFGTDGEAPSATNNAKSYAATSEENNLQAESWAKGTRDGSPDVIRSNAATDNASYYNIQSKLWANYGTDGDTPTSSNNAKSYSDSSNESRLESESWAVGTRGGQPDSIRQNASTDNAKAYSESSNTSAQSSEESNLQSESWAKGTRNGQPDSERQNASTDNSRYYSEQSKLWANFGADGSTPTASNNAKTYAEQASASATAAAASETHAAQSDTNATAKASEADASAQAAATSEAHAAQSETNAATSESHASTSELNASHSASSAATSESNAAASESAAATSESNALASQNAAAQSASNAATSESNALVYMNDAQAAKTAAETAQGKAERAMVRYPRIKTNDNWEVWNPSDESWEDTGHKCKAEATIEYSYQNSTSGTVHPSGVWTQTPDPQPGRYLWSRMKYIWTNGNIDYFYNVAYIGVNGTGSVNSVNGMSGDVVFDGTSLYVYDEAEDKETIYGAITRIGNSITNSEIDLLF